MPEPQENQNQDDSKEKQTEVVEPESAPDGEESLMLGGDDDAATEEGSKDEQAEAEKQSEPEPDKGEDPIEYSLQLPEDSPFKEEKEEKEEEVRKFAEEHRLSNEVAQAILDRESAAVAGWAKKQQDVFVETAKGWIDDAKNHKEFGREKFEETNSLVRGLLGEFASEELKQGLRNTGFDNYAPLWEMLARVAYARKDDQIAVASAAASSEKVPLARKMYPDLAPKGA